MTDTDLQLQLVAMQAQIDELRTLITDPLTAPNLAAASKRAETSRAEVAGQEGMVIIGTAYGYDCGSTEYPVVTATDKTLSIEKWSGRAGTQGIGKKSTLRFDRETLESGETIVRGIHIYRLKGVPENPPQD